MKRILDQQSDWSISALPTKIIYKQLVEGAPLNSITDVKSPLFGVTAG